MVGHLVEWTVGWVVDCLVKDLVERWVINRVVVDAWYGWVDGYRCLKGRTIS